MCRVFIGEGVFVGAFFHSYTLSIINELIGIIMWFIFMGVYWMTMTVSQLYFWKMMTVISIEKGMRLPSVNLFLRENADCYVNMAFRSHSKF